MIDISVAAYTAGLLDGEGHLGVRPWSKNGYHNFFPNVAISNTNLEVIEWLISHFGGHYGIWDNKTHQQKRIYKWYINSLDAIKTFLEVVQPFVIIKREHVEAMLAYVRIGNSAFVLGNPIYDKEEADILLAAREDIYWWLKDLNGRVRQ
uniref:Homing endonuclease n=1 Tax=viral metagenome TaxID=1070528 RepID=A0A6M3J4T0_9ZZZZ